MTAGAPRFAVISPYVARWLIAELDRVGRGSAAFREQAAMWRSAGYRGRADELEFAWAQLRSAAAEQQHAPVDTFDLVESGPAVESKVGGGSVHEQITTAEAMRMLGLTSTQWVVALVKRGDLTGSKVGGLWMVNRGSVEALRDVRRTA